MYQNGKILIAKANGKPLYLEPGMANRHGLIAGATGTGKTVTVKVLAESFSDMGVPVFLADIKGDLSGMCQEGEAVPSVSGKVSELSLDGFRYQKFPARYWDIWGDIGHPVRVTISDMGPVMLSNLLGLTEVQAGVLNITFRVADDNGLLLLDMKDLRKMLTFVSENRKEICAEYGNVSTASVGAIQRALLALEDEGGAEFFGEPALNITDWIRTDHEGRGYINILNSTTLIQKPLVYSTFLLWMLTELFERLPEVGDPEKPRLVFFFDEAHLLFNGAAKSLLQKITQVVKLIRSKGVGVYFISQSPSDIPDEVLAQLSNRIQHALRAYTPSEQKYVRAAAAAFRENPTFDVREAITLMGVGEALVSMLDEKGIPSVVERAQIVPPQSKIGPGDAGIIDRIIACDEFELKYRESIDRESAYEILTGSEEEAENARLMEEEEREQAREAAAYEKQQAREALAREKQEAGEAAASARQAAREAAEREKQARKQRKVLERAATNAASSVARSITTNAVNTALGGRKSSTSTIVKRATTTALSSLMRTGTTSIVRGLFGNRK